jgi:hypothetical protein
MKRLRIVDCELRIAGLAIADCRLIPTIDNPPITNHQSTIRHSPIANRQSTIR